MMMEWIRACTRLEIDESRPHRALHICHTNAGIVAALHLANRARAGDARSTDIIYILAERA
jgi:hypothetical protein